MFTANLVKAAPVLVSSAHLKAKGAHFRAIIANSGCANACTGPVGKKDAEAMCSAAADLLGVKAADVLVASTGVIGRNLPVAKVRKALPALLAGIEDGTSDGMSAAQAVMTTDTFPKIAERTITLGGKKATVWGCAKGAGMIHPDLKALHATMLSFILTDAAITQNLLAAALEAAVKYSFNCVTVDSDTSTNDTLVALANGAAGNKTIAAENADFKAFSKALADVCLELAKMLAKDGEGSTKLVEIEVKNGAGYEAAKKIAATIATSPLVKTAIFGNDANWGRILAAAGRAGIAINPDAVDISIGGLAVARRGMPVNFSEARAKKILQKDEVKIVVDLHQGKHTAKYYTCDYSFDYIKINASYRS
jgi:glutamate N-acetyltransferase/amino-acid N-acetyltransferase